MIDKLNPNVQNTLIQDTIQSAIRTQFPIVGKQRSLILDGDLSIHDDLEDWDFPRQKETKLSGRSWQIPVTGSFKLIDNATGKVLDTVKDLRIANIPKMTNRFSMLIDGNEYTTVNQFLLKPGVYTRKKANDEMESRFNLAVGYNFTLTMNPQDGIFYIYVAAQKFHVYTLLSALGTSDAEMERYWGKELFDKNKNAGINEADKEIPLLWEKLRRQKLTYSEALTNIKDYLNKTKLDVGTTGITLGKSFEKVSPETLLYASKKLLAVLRGELPEDERDSLLFKKLRTVDDLLKEYIQKNSTTVLRNLASRADNKDNIREIISSDTYTGSIKKFFTTGDLSNPSPQTNPVEMIGEWRKTTITGTGGIQSPHAITYKTRDVHPSQLSFVDPILTPESAKSGVSLSLTTHVIKSGEDMQSPVIYPDGTIHYVTPTEFYQMKIGFADQHEKGKASHDVVKSMYRGVSTMFDKKDVDAYILHPNTMFSWQTNLVPFLGNNSGNRALVAAKMASQSVSLVAPQSPLVKVQSRSGKTFDSILGNYLNPKVPPTFGNAVVTKIEPEYITIKNDKEESVRIGLYKNFPLNQESFLDSHPIVAVGDKVKPLDMLAVTNFNDEHKNYASGINATVAYMPWYGYNFEDGAVITESLANQFTSQMILKKTISVEPDGVLELKKFRAYYPDKIPSGNVAKLDETGVIKEGEKVQHGDILVAYLQKTDMTDTEKVLRQMNRIISQPYKDRSLIWDEDVQGDVLYVRRIGKEIRIHIKIQQPMVVGDKLAARFGDKHIITRIIPDDEAPYAPDGTRIDIIENPHGVIGRMNMGQLLEAAAGKLAKKTGKPYLVENFSKKDYLEDITTQLKENKIDPDEYLRLGKDGKLTINPVFWGVKHYLKLMHVVEHKYKSRGLPGSYDSNEQPAHAQEAPGQAVDPLQTFSLLAHGDTREIMYEMGAVKGQKNDEYWRQVQLGLPPTPPQTNFVFDKMLAYMQAAGINIKKDGYTLQVFPATSSDVLKVSKGELTDARQILRGKDLAAIEGGLFDPKLTGGPRGANWTHIKLADAMPNPLYEPAIRIVLGMNSAEFDKIMNETLDEGGLTGAKLIETKLKSLNVPKALKAAELALQKAPPTAINTLNRRVRYLRTLHDFKLDPVEAYMMSVVPVLPPKYRPIYPLPSGDIQVAPINKHYRVVALINESIKDIRKTGIDDKEFNKDNRVNLYQSLKAMTGLIDPIGNTKEKYEGLLGTLAGSSPKSGFIQSKVWSRRQDLSARSTITVEPSLGIDEVGIPDTMLKDIFHPFIIREMVNQGYTPINALEEFKNWSPIADRALTNVVSKRTVVLNRAPSLHKHSVQAFKPVRFSGSSIRLNPLIFKGLGADLDGDSYLLYYQGLIDIELILNAKIDSMRNLLLSDIISIIDSKYIDILTLDKIPYEENITAIKDKQMFAELLFNMIQTGTKREFITMHISQVPHLINTKVITPKGTEEYDVPEGLYTMSYKDGKIQAMPISKFSIHRDLNTVKVVTTSNREIICSEDHSLFCYNFLTNTLEKTKPIDSIGKLMCKPQKLNFDPTWIQNDIPEEGYFVGAAVGDWWAAGINTTSYQRAKNQVCGAITDPTQRNLTINFIQKFIEKDAHCSIVDNAHEYKGFACDSTKVTFTSEKWSTYLRENIGHMAKNKHLPKDWLFHTKAYKLGILAGLLDTDGSISINNSRKTPQFVASFSTISDQLKYDFQLLCADLGIRTSVSKGKITDAGNQEWHLNISMVDLIQYKNELPLLHPIKKQNLLDAIVYKDDTDIIPLPSDLWKLLSFIITEKIDNNLYLTLAKFSKLGYINRISAKRIEDFLPEHVLEQPSDWIRSVALLKKSTTKHDKYYAKFIEPRIEYIEHNIEHLVKCLTDFIDFIHNDSIFWEKVTTVTPECIDHTATAWDITVPDSYTFMGANGLIIYDTMSVHVPVSDKALRESTGMFPSKNLFKAGDKDQMNTLAQDYQLGLYYLSIPGKQTGRTFATVADARKAKLNPQDVFTFNGKKTTLGQLLVNSKLPEKIQDLSRVMNEKTTRKLLETLYMEYPKYYDEVINHFKDIGRTYGTEFGNTISITDMKINRKYRDDILTKYHKLVKPNMTPEEVSDIYAEALDKIQEGQDKEAKATNRFYNMLDSGSSSKKGQVLQILSMPGIMRNVHGVPIPHPVTNSWSEGLDTFDYWNTSYGARKGVVDRAVNTQDSGALNKELLFNTKNLLVIEDDCGTPNGIEFDIDSKDVKDRYLLKDVPSVGKRNDLVDAGLIGRAQKKNLKSLWVRSPLTCETDGGLCVKCYGLMVNGRPPQLGENVGVLDGQAVTERSTQLTMQTFHTGGAGKGSSLLKGFPRLEELLFVPKKIADAAVLAKEPGVVRDVLPNPAGGYNLTVNENKYYIPRDRELLVRVGNKVERGDRLTNGAIRPQELSELKDHLTAQRYIVDEIDKIYENKFSKKTFETVLHGISDNADLVDVPEGTETTWLKGDTVSLNKVKKLNRELALEGKPTITHTPYFAPIDIIPMYSKDWLSRLTTNRLMGTLQEAPAEGQITDTKGVNPLVSYLQATIFGQDLDPAKKRFY